ncbi:hypothetical protein DIPPA_31948 [Diplonema papillatum]|nr:hypothetical protein DIPPA_31948 [Diplonema papillatum]
MRAAASLAKDDPRAVDAWLGIYTVVAAMAQGSADVLVALIRRSESTIVRAPQDTPMKNDNVDAWLGIYTVVGAMAQGSADVLVALIRRSESTIVRARARLVEVDRAPVTTCMRAAASLAKDDPRAVDAWLGIYTVVGAMAQGSADVLVALIRRSESTIVRTRAVRSLAKGRLSSTLSSHQHRDWSVSGDH